MFKYFIFILTVFFINILNAEDSLLTLKQKLDRLQREVIDLSQTVYQGSRDNQLQSNQPDEELKNLTSNLTILDLRIYNLEKELKKLNDELIIQIFDEVDDLKNLYEKLSLNIDTRLLQSQNNIIDQNEISIANDNIKDEVTIVDDINKEEDTSVKENILGKIVISPKDLSDKTKELIIENESIEEKVAKLSPENEYQRAFDLLTNSQFSEAKEALEKFIINHQDDKLSSSAHYWLGEIYLLKKEYKEAALVFHEGYQKFPKSIKAPDMLYKLSESLIHFNKKDDSCNTLKKITEEFPQNKLKFTAENKIIDLNCNFSTE